MISVNCVETQAALFITRNQAGEWRVIFENMIKVLVQLSSVKLQVFKLTATLINNFMANHAVILVKLLTDLKKRLLEKNVKTHDTTEIILTSSDQRHFQLSFHLW